MAYVALDKKVIQIDLFSCFSTKACVVDTDE